MIILANPGGHHERMVLAITLAAVNQFLNGGDRSPLDIRVTDEDLRQRQDRLDGVLIEIHAEHALALPDGAEAGGRPAGEWPRNGRWVQADYGLQVLVDEDSPQTTAALAAAVTAAVIDWAARAREEERDAWRHGAAAVISIRPRPAAALGGAPVRVTGFQPRQ